MICIFFHNFYMIFGSFLMFWFSDWSYLHQARVMNCIESDWFTLNPDWSRFSFNTTPPHVSFHNMIASVYLSAKINSKANFARKIICSSKCKFVFFQHSGLYPPGCKENWWHQLNSNILWYEQIELKKEPWFSSWSIMVFTQCTYNFVAIK